MICLLTGQLDHCSCDVFTHGRIGLLYLILTLNSATSVSSVDRVLFDGDAVVDAPFVPTLFDVDDARLLTAEVTHSSYHTLDLTMSTYSD